MEIESALCAHPGVAQAVVTARADGAGDAQLVAYLTTRSDGVASSAALRLFLRDRLPAHMIPGVFVTLAAMPSTGNGKIDRDALPDPGRLRPQIDAPFAPASSPLEEQVAGIWAGVLGIDRVGIHDDFFELGGHSLSAARVISRVVQAFALDLPLKALFDAPTVAAMAKVIERTGAGSALDGVLQRAPVNPAAT